MGTESLPFINKLCAFMCCPFIAFFSECGVSKGIQKILGSALAGFLTGDLVLSSIPSTALTVETVVKWSRWYF